MNYSSYQIFPASSAPSASPAPRHLHTSAPSPQTIWQGFHWSFFINIQGLIVCLQRFEKQVKFDNLVEAEIELKTATELMLASSASMILAGSFSKQEYETQVRETMMPPYVESNNFSGLMSWEHSTLIQLWKRLSPIFADLPDSLKTEHENFTNAHKTLANAHRSVCEKFGGDGNGSLRCKDNTALNTLDKFNANRKSLINP
ncbi:MAG: siderophore biosynthesis protein [Cyanobacteria bacterium P01_G01_bin.67]